jgi:hypothetical protein
MQPILSMGMWTSLPTEVRHRIRVAFNIPRSSTVDVNDGVVVSDGTTPEDFKALTTEKMQTFLSDVSTDFHKLFDKVVAKINEDMLGKKQENIAVSSDAPVTVIINDAPKKKKHAKSK